MVRGSVKPVCQAVPRRVMLSHNGRARQGTAPLQTRSRDMGLLFQCVSLLSALGTSRRRGGYNPRLPFTAIPFVPDFIILFRIDRKTSAFIRPALRLNRMSTPGIFTGSVLVQKFSFDYYLEFSIMEY